MTQHERKPLTEEQKARLREKYREIKARDAGLTNSELVERAEKAYWDAAYNGSSEEIVEIRYDAWQLALSLLGEDK